MGPRATAPAALAAALTATLAVATAALATACSGGDGVASTDPFTNDEKAPSGQTSPGFTNGEKAPTGQELPGASSSGGTSSGGTSSGGTSSGGTSSGSVTVDAGVSDPCAGTYACTGDGGQATIVLTGNGRRCTGGGLTVIDGEIKDESGATIGVYSNGRILYSGGSCTRR